MDCATTIPCVSDSVCVRDSGPLVAKVIVWLLLFPLFFLAGYGQFFFFNAHSNSALSYGNVGLVSGMDSAQSSIVSITATTMLCIIGLILSTRYKAVLHACRDNKLFVALAFLCIASTMWSQFPSYTVKSTIVLTLDTLFAFYIAKRFRSEDQLNLFYLFGWIAIVLSLFVAVVFPVVGVDQREGVGAWQGIFPHKNIAAIVMSYLLSVGLSRKCSGFISKALNASYIALALFLIVMSQSRTGWILVAALFLFMVAVNLLTRFKVRERPFVVLATTMCCGTIIVAVIRYLPTLLRAVGKDPSMTGRTDLWAAVFHSIANHPLLGYGYGAFWSGLKGESANLSMTLGWIPGHAQSGFLDAWLQVGGLGVGLILLTLIVALRQGMTCLRNGRDAAAQWYLGIILITVISNFDERSLMFPVCLEWVFYVLACVGLADRAKEVKSRLRPSTGSELTDYGVTTGEQIPRPVY